MRNENLEVCIAAWHVESKMETSSNELLNIDGGKGSVSNGKATSITKSYKRVSKIK